MSEQPERWRPASHTQDLAGLGPLEAAVMRVVWDQGRVSVRDVYETLRQRRRTAYTTVMTTLTNLKRKRLVSEDRSGRAYIYVATMTDVEVVTAILDVIVEELMGGDAQPLLAYLQSKAARQSPS